MSRNERGMTLIELSIALVVFSVIVGGALSFMRSQSKAMSRGSDNMTLIQNMRYASNVLERDLRTLGSNVGDKQPFIIYAGADVVAFNADYASNVADDPFAVYHDPDAPDAVVMALTLAQRATIPTTSVAYPDISYLDVAGLNSPAETIVFYFASDTGTTRTDDFALYRKVNGLAAEIVARGLLRDAGQSFFAYERLITPLSSSAYTQTVPAASLPLRHTIAEHGVLADTAAAAIVDSLRAVRFRFATTNGLTGAAERKRNISRLVRLPNAGMAVRRTCGDEPLLGTGLTAAFVVQDGVSVARLTWNAATDETGGELDVVRYVIWRRLQADPNWGTPYLSVPAGSATHTYDDETVEAGNSYVYSLAAQDCTPKLSSQTISNTVVIP